MQKMTNSQRYTSVAIILHWVMALAILLMLVSGFSMASDSFLPKSLRFEMVQWHKSLGVLLLVAFFLRIVWRLLHKPPTLPANFSKFEALLAHLGHLGLYALMFLMPFSGWLMVSSSVYGLPTYVFGWFVWPHIPDVAGNEAVHHWAGLAHWILAFCFVGLIFAHIAAVVKHALWDKHNILPRMLWRAHKGN